MAVRSEIDVTFDNAAFVKRQLRLKLDRRLGEAADTFADKIRLEYAGQSDHTLANLQSLGHPYATTAGFGSVPRGPIPHDPWWMVHTQAGDADGQHLVDGIGVRHIENAKGRFGWAVYAKGDVARYVIWGTERMVGRPFLSAALALEAESLLVNQIVGGP